MTARTVPNPMTPTTASWETRQSIAKRLLEQAGTTYARESGLNLSDKPMPLFGLLVMALLLSTRISAEIAVRAAAELRSSGLTTARHMADADRQTIITALERAHYRRYDESAATRLHDNAEVVLARYHGDRSAAAGSIQRYRTGRRRHLPPRSSRRLDVGTTVLRLTGTRGCSIPQSPDRSRQTRLASRQGRHSATRSGVGKGIPGPLTSPEPAALTYFVNTAQ